MGLIMRHDVLKVLFARALKQSGFDVKLEQDGGLLDRRRPADVHVKEWLVVSNWKENTSLSIDVAIIDPTGGSHSHILKLDGVGAAATKYEDRKRNIYRDIKGSFSPFVLEAQGGFGAEAQRLVRELERRRKERECLPNIRGANDFQRLGEINLVTAIGFELVRRNARMILDRAPENEPLIPAEQTKIRLEMERKKKRAKGSRKNPGDSRSDDGCEPTVERLSLEKKVPRKASEDLSIPETNETNPEDLHSDKAYRGSTEQQGHSITSQFIIGKEIVVKGEKSGGLLLLETNKTKKTKKITTGNCDGDLDVSKRNGGDEEQPGFRVRRERSSATWKKVENVKKSEGDATNIIKNISAPHMNEDQISAEWQNSIRTKLKTIKGIGVFANKEASKESGHFFNIKSEEMKQGDGNNISSTKNKMSSKEELETFSSEHAGPGLTTRLLPRQAAAYNCRKKNSGKIDQTGLGYTTRLLPRQASECTDLTDYDCSSNYSGFESKVQEEDKERVNSLPT